MHHDRRPPVTALIFAVAGSLLASPAAAQDQAAPIPSGEIAVLQTKLAEAGESASSSARKKLSLKRILREAESVLEENTAAPNRFEVLGLVFQGRQQLIRLEDSPENRAAFLATGQRLAAAPNAYAAIRLDADLLLSQIEAAKQGADAHQRAEALIPLIDRYRDTEVETKVIKIAMIMALELGNTRVIDRLREAIAERCPGDYAMINFQRDQLAGQVFGAPFVSRLEQADGKPMRFPMDILGTTTGLYFWSKEGDGLEDLRELAQAYKTVWAEGKGEGRYQFVSINLDDLPDAGQSILRKHGLNWPAVKLPGGREHPVFKTYCRWDPKVITVSPTGYAAIFASGGRSSRGYERNMGSWLARSWAARRFTNQLQSVYAGEFLVVDPTGEFDPAAPPEYKATAAGASGKNKLKRTENSVPEDKLRAIQACFVKPPGRYLLPYAEALAGYQKADKLCRDAISAHGDAPDLWIVRNRRIVALTGLWKLANDRQSFDAAVAEARATLDAGLPRGADVVARFCLARQALRAADADAEQVAEDLIQATGGDAAPAPALVLASLLALDVGDRRLHERYRREFLDKHARHPMMWTATAYLLDRYHRYWMYHPPFTAGWTYGRRQNYFMAAGDPEDADRRFQGEFKTPDGKTVKLPEASQGKWTVVEFVPNAQDGRYLHRYGAFVYDRPFDDVNLMVAVLDDDTEAVKAALAEQEAKRRKDTPELQTLIVPGGVDNPMVNQLGIVVDGNKPSFLILRPDGSITNVFSDLASSRFDPVQTIEWHDEKAVDDALAKGDLEEAKRLAFTFAPVEQLPPPDADNRWKPKPISAPHLRSRGKVYMAMKDWKSAYDDIHEVYLRVNSQAGYISMRTTALDEAERLEAAIIDAQEKASEDESQ